MRHILPAVMLYVIIIGDFHSVTLRDFPRRNVHITDNGADLVGVQYFKSILFASFRRLRRRPQGTGPSPWTAAGQVLSSYSFPPRSFSGERPVSGKMTAYGALS